MTRKGSGVGIFIGLGILAVILVTLVGFVVGFLNFRADVIKLEVAVESQYKANQSTYDNMWKKFREMYSITEAQAEQTKDIYMALISGRYEDDKSLFKMITEDNPQLVDVYSDLQVTISSDRDNFNNEQKKVIDKIGHHNVYIREHFIFNMFYNAQELDLDEYVVTSGTTDDVFNSKKADEITFE